MNETYHMVHIPSGEVYTCRWADVLPLMLSEIEKIRQLNEWNRIAMIGSTHPTYHYWM